MPNRLGSEFRVVVGPLGALGEGSREKASPSPGGRNSLLAAGGSQPPWDGDQPWMSWQMWEDLTVCWGPWLSKALGGRWTDPGLHREVDAKGGSGHIPQLGVGCDRETWGAGALRAEGQA